MVSVVQLEQWREAYGHIYQARIEDDIFVFRPLTVSEIEMVNRHFKNEKEVEEVLCQIAVIYPEEINFSSGDIKAGTPKILSRAILDKSNILTAQQPIDALNVYRMKMTQLQFQAEATILSAFPQIKLDEIRNWNIEQLMEWLARAEWVLQEIHGLPVGFINPQDELDEDMEQAEELEDSEFTESQEEVNPLRELAKQIRAEGRDPMIELAPIILKKPTDNYVPIPVIGGVKAWRKDEVLNNVREQLQYVVRKRQ